MSKKDAIYFFKEIIDNDKLKNDIQEISAKYENADTSFSDIKSLIDTEIIPLANKYGFKFSALEALEVEHDIFNSENGKKQLGLEELEDVAGGISKKGIAFAMSALICLPLFSSAASAFDAPSHSYTTTSGVDVLLNSKADDEGYKNFFTEDMKKSLEESCNKPDQDENDKIYLHHFYSPETEKNFAGGTTTALSKLEDHYKNAISLLKSNNKEKAYEELARAMHFLEDLNTPVHTHNDTIISTGVDALDHNMFEKICSQVINEVPVESIKVTEDDYTNNLKMSLHDFGHNCAVESKKLYDQLENNTSMSSVRSIAKQSIQNATKAVTLLLNRFYNDVGQTISNQMDDTLLNNEKIDSSITQINKDLICQTKIIYGAESFYGSEDNNNSQRTRSAMINQIILDKKGHPKASNTFCVKFVYDGNTVKIIDENKNIVSNVENFDTKNVNLNNNSAAQIINNGDCTVKKVMRLEQKQGFFNRIFNLNYGWKNVSTSEIQITCTPNGTLYFNF